MHSYVIGRWGARLTRFLRRNRRVDRAGDGLSRRRPTLTKRRHWHALVRALEGSVLSHEGGRS